MVCLFYSCLFLLNSDWQLMPFNLFTFNPPPPYHTGCSIAMHRDCVSKYEWPILIQRLFAECVVTRRGKDISWCITARRDADVSGGGLFVPLSLPF